MGEKLLFMTLSPLTLERFFLLLQPDAAEEFVISTLETVQAAILSTSGQELAFIVDQPWQMLTPLSQVRSKLKRSAEKLEARFDLCVMGWTNSPPPGR